MRASYIILLLVFEVIISDQKCTKGENNCSLCNPMTNLCLECDYDVYVPDENGGCKKSKTCSVGYNYCLDCEDDNTLCKECEEGYYPDKNGGCSYSANCNISYKGKCLKCKENYILIENINICKSIYLEEFKNCEKINTVDGICENCFDGYFLNSEDKKCTKTENCKESIFDKCILCDKGYYLDKREGKCKEQKGNMLYCKEAIDDESCNICEDNYFFDDEGNCTNTNFCKNRGELGYCKDFISGYYLSYFGNTCTNTENCYTGINSLGICDKCFSGYYIDFNDGKCKTGSGDIESYNDAYQVISKISIYTFYHPYVVH